MKSLLCTATLLALAGGLIASPAVAAAPGAPHEGPHPLRSAQPLPVRETVKREAVEFFWYDCTHSRQLELPLERWADRHRSDVTLRRVPAVWPGAPAEQTQLAHARLFYTLQRLGEVDRLQLAVFDAVADRRADLTTEDTAAAWAAAKGVDAARFRAAYRSDEVRRDTEGAAALFTRYEVAELPTVVVQGSSRTSPSRAGGVDQMPAALDRLVAQP